MCLHTTIYIARLWAALVCRCLTREGVGKNKIVDHFLQQLQQPREYMQLHRDSTVQTLTQQTSVRDGGIVYEVLLKGCTLRSPCIRDCCSLQLG